MIRVFPRRTTHSPLDSLAFFGPPPLEQFRPPIQPVRVSCVFTWDRPRAEALAAEWRAYYPDVQVGGPAYDDTGGDFEPGHFLEYGYVITSRGCPNKCDFCFVPKREGGLRSLPIKEGWIVLDNNLLACCDSHIEAVFMMLRYQNRCVKFTGGFESRRITRRVISLLQSVKLPQQNAALFLAYDKPWQDKVVRSAADRLRKAGMCRRQIGCYVLCGYEGDTPGQAAERCEYALSFGALPFAMIYRDESGNEPSGDWRQIRAHWIRPAQIYHDHPGLD